MSATEDDEVVDLRAAEYVIGSLDASERRAFATRLVTDEAARGAVAGWERRLAPLRLVGDEVTPPSELWSRIEQALGFPTARRFGVVDGGAAAVLRSRNRWRGLALSATGIAAALVAFLIVREVGVLKTPDAATYVAAINRGGDKPALIVTVDLKTRQVVVRPVAAQTPPGRSLELWYVAGGHAPRSMGLVSEASAHVAIPADAEADGAASFAVSVEPPGGSKTGGPSGAVLYSGQLVKQ